MCGGFGGSIVMVGGGVEFGLGSVEGYLRLRAASLTVCRLRRSATS
jgi:hypothetical protein